MTRLPLSVLLLVSVVVLVAPGCDAYGVRVRARREECFEHFMSQGRPFTVQFQVVAGGQLDVDFSIKNPAGDVMHEESRKIDSKMSFVASEEGMYTVCFSNRMSRVTAKSVVFDIWLQDKLQVSKTELAKSEQLQSLWHNLHTLRTLVDGSRHDQKYLILRLKRHMQTSESNASRVQLWFVLEVLLLVGMATVQLVFLRMHVNRHSGKVNKGSVPGTPGARSVPGAGSIPGGRGGIASGTGILSPGQVPGLHQR